MLKKVVITAALGAAVVGGGTAALASSGSHDVAVPDEHGHPDLVIVGPAEGGQEQARGEEQVATRAFVWPAPCTPPG